MKALLLSILTVWVESELEETEKWQYLFFYHIRKAPEKLSQFKLLKDSAYEL